MSTDLRTEETEAEREVARFLASQPSPEAIIAFHPSPAVAARLSALIVAEHEGPLDAVERRELDTYLAIEHLLRLVKIEARRRLGHQAR
jgi:hypothetical protein